MRRIKKIAITFVTLLIVLVVFAPPLLGVAMQKLTYRYLSASDLPIDILTYERGWFSSKVSARIRVPELKVHQFLIKMGFLVDAPVPLELTMKGHVWHGPILYNNGLRLSQLFGLAAIDRKIFVPAEQKNVFALLGLDDAVLKSNYSYISFLGNFSEHFELVNYLAVSPVGTSLRFSSFKGKVSFNPLSNRVKGNITIENLAMSDNDFVVYMPTATTQFNLKKDSSGLWIGNKTFSLPDVIGRDTTTKLFEINGVAGSGSLQQTKGLMNLAVSFNVKKLEWEDEIYGPLDLQISADGLGMQSILDFVTVYQQIAQRGEMYEGQLEQKMTTMLASSFLPGASIQINTLKLDAPKGNVTAALQVVWPEQFPSSPERLSDLIQFSNLKGDIRIARSLVDQLIDVLSDFNYPDQIQPNQRDKLIYLQDSVRIGTEQNVYLIIALIQGNAIPREDGVMLLTMIRNGVPVESYVEEVQKLFLTKKVAPDTSYFLVWQYASLHAIADEFNQLIHNYKDAAKTDMQHWINDFVKQGFIAQDDKDYTVSILRENEALKLNGKEMKSE